MRATIVLLVWLSGVTSVFSQAELQYYWSGAVTTTSAVVKGKISEPTGSTRLVYSTQADLSNPQYSGYVQALAQNFNVVEFPLTGLLPGTQYYYAFEVFGTLNNSPEKIGSFKTFTEGAFSYSFTVASCNFFPNNQVYEQMRALNPLFYLNGGDLHYANPNTANVIDHIDPYEMRVLSQPREKAFLQHVPVAYVWDDHDFCGNNNVGVNGCGTAAKEAYKIYVPHYPLADANGPDGIYQAFTVGRVRFIMSDLRSQRANGHIMSDAQKQWVKNEMLHARDNGMVIAWVTSVSFSGTQSDNWGGFTADREEFGNFFRDSAIQNMFILSGDAHMLAIDNGDNTDFSTGQNNPNKYPVFQAAALNNFGSDKGGIYSEGGTFPNQLFTSQWGEVFVNDFGGDEICFEFNGYRLNTLTGVREKLITYAFCRTVSSPLGQPDPGKKNDPLVTPNPNNGEFQLNLAGFQGYTEIRIISEDGRTVFEKTFNNGENYQFSNQPALKTGIYFLMVKNKAGNQIEKFIVQ